MGKTATTRKKKTYAQDKLESNVLKLEYPLFEKERKIKELKLWHHDSLANVNFSMN